MINAAAGAFAESSEPALQPAVQTLAQKAFAQKTEADVRQFFEKNLATLPNAQAKVQALTLLADYEQYNGNYSNAADCYRRAAGFDTTDKKTALLLDAVRVLLCGGSMDSARSLLSEIAAALPVSDEDPYYRRAAVYDTWRLLAEDRADRAVPLITAYTKKKAFSEYHPALLFTLWWVNGDEDAKQRLLKEYPSGMEAAAVNGTVTVQPSTFWYLMPRSGLAQKPPEIQPLKQAQSLKQARYRKRRKLHRNRALHQKQRPLLLNSQKQQRAPKHRLSLPIISLDFIRQKNMRKRLRPICKKNILLPL